jgi:aminoglycoside phosphotransferase (APT) family kinase protein
MIPEVANEVPDVSDESDDAVTAGETDVLKMLEAFVRARLGERAVVDGFTRASIGRSRQNWLFDAVWESDGVPIREQLIARRDPLGGLLQTDRAAEFGVLQALEAAPIPTPQARWLDGNGDELGRPSLVMVRLEGSCDYFALNGPGPLDERVDLARRLCSLLADVHNVDWRAIGLGDQLTDPGPTASLAALDEWERVLERDQVEPYPELAFGASWLRANAPSSPRTVLVHGDFKVGNVLLDADGEIVGLLDWELAHLGDLHEDLGWVTQPLRTKEHYITGSWERDELLAHYETVSGHTVDRKAVHWWNVLAAFKTAVMQASGLRAYQEGRSDEHYKPTAPVLKAILRAALGSSDSSESGGDIEVGERDAFLVWDTTQTLTLLGPSAPPGGVDPLETNEAARGALAEFISGLSFTNSTDELRSKIGRHLLQRVSTDPALARRKASS